MDTQELVQWFQSMPVDSAEVIKLEVAVAIDRAIKDSNLSRTEVAALLQTSPSWVTKVLRGDVNLTIESMARLCHAVGYELQIKVLKRQEAATVGTETRAAAYRPFDATSNGKPQHS